MQPLKFPLTSGDARAPAAVSFDKIRFQMAFPCAAQCRWCSTFRKNPLFSAAWKSGDSNRIHAFYLDVVKRFKPRVVVLSGGEPLLLPDIGSFIVRALEHCRKVHLYTSFQYPLHVLDRLHLCDIPADRLLLIHSCIHFLPGPWDELTGGFPHDLYVANLVRAKNLPFRKKIKLVLNHEDVVEEADLFRELVRPDGKFHLCLKLLNDQNNGYGAPLMRQTAERVRSILGLPLDFEGPDPNLVSAIASDRVLETCPYRHSSIEMRFALWRIVDGQPTLKVRFCPHFGPTTHHTYVLGRHNPRKLEHWYRSGQYRLKCDSCRLLNYSARGEAGASRGKGEPLVQIAGKKPASPAGERRHISVAPEAGQLHTLAAPAPLILYTAVLGSYDQVAPNPFPFIRALLFTDQPDLASEGWDVVHLPPVAELDARIRKAREIKLRPQRYLPPHQCSVWIDGNLALRKNPSAVLRHLTADVATFRYPSEYGPRDCIYQEAEACIRKRKDDPSLIRTQMERYRSRGYPPHNGLVETSLLIRRDTPACRAFCEAWAQEVALGSRRDQLSFNYAAWLLHMPFAIVPGSRKSNSYTRWAPHRDLESHAATL